MKSFKNIIIAALLTIAILLCYTAAFFTVRSSIVPRGHFTVDEKIDSKKGLPISYSYSDNLMIKNNKLYYDYLQSGNSIAKSGIYEIDEKGCRIINDFYIESCRDWEDFEILGKIKDLYNHNKRDDELDDEMNDENLYKITDYFIIYLSKDFYIKEIDRKTNKCVFKKKLNKKLIDLSELWLYEFHICGNKLLLVDKGSDKKVKIYDVTNDFNILLSFENKMSGSNKYFYEDDYYFENNICCYKNKLYMTSDDGIYELDTDTAKNKQLTDEKADNIFIFGDNWIYFTDNSYNLYRISKDGNNKETVFKTGW